MKFVQRRSRPYPETYSATLPTHYRSTVRTLDHDRPVHRKTEHRFVTPVEPGRRSRLRSTGNRLSAQRANHRLQILHAAEPVQCGSSRPPKRALGQLRGFCRQIHFPGLVHLYVFNLNFSATTSQPGHLSSVTHYALAAPFSCTQTLQ